MGGLTKILLTDEFGNEEELLSDNIFRGVPVVIDSEHHEIHCGDSYVTSYTKDISNGGTLDLLVVVPNEVPADEAYPNQSLKLYHAIAQATSENEASFSIYEGPTISALGTALGVNNRNRNSDLTSGLAIYHTPTISAVGTLLETQHWGSSGKIGGGTGRQDEFVLRNNTMYLYRITNISALANHSTIMINHYIHPGV